MYRWRVLIERSKVALDEIYQADTDASKRITAALEVYGSDKLKDEFKFCVDQLLHICASDPAEKLRDIIFARRTTNAFPSTFAILLLAVHEIVVGEGKFLVNVDKARAAITDIAPRIPAGQGTTSAIQRRKNIDIVKGALSSAFEKVKSPPKIYGNHTSADLDTAIRRSEIELAEYELKQGLLTLSGDRKIDASIIDKICKTICAIANNGPNKVGHIIIGVADKQQDVDRIKKLDKIEPKNVGRRVVVGVAREAAALGISMEEYFQRIRDAINSSNLSSSLKSSIVSNIDFNSYFGYGIVVIFIPSQK